MQRAVVGVGLAAVAFAGCFYTEPVNRQPKVFPIVRLCDVAHPADPCTAANLHHRDRVMVEAEFSDPDGDATNGRVQWRISACSGPIAVSATVCDVKRLHDPDIQTQPPYPEFTVPSVLTGTTLVTQTIVFELIVYDERGAASSIEEMWNVIPDPAIARRPSEVSAP